MLFKLERLDRHSQVRSQTAKKTTAVHRSYITEA